MITEDTIDDRIKIIAEKTREWILLLRMSTIES